MIKIKSNQQLSEKKRAVLDLAKVVFSNACSLICGVMVGFLIPKLLSYQDYGYYKEFGLYVGYLGLLQFGIADGVYLFFAGKKDNEINQNRLHSVLIVYFFIELIISIVGVICSLFFIKASLSSAIVFILVSIENLLCNMENIYSSICQATKRFSQVSGFSIIKSLVTISYVGCTYFMIKDNLIEPSYYLYCILTIFASFLSSILYMVYLRKIVFANSFSFLSAISDIKKYIKLGIPLTVANLTTTLLMSIDKQFINIFYPVDKSNIFSIYSFAYSLLSLITVATSAVSSVLFPYMSGKDKTKLINAYPKLHFCINCFMGISCFSYFFLVWFIENFLVKYTDSMPIFRFLLPGLVVNSIISVLMHNYYKSFNKENVYFIQNLVFLLIAVFADVLSYFLYIKYYSPNNPILITISSLVVMCLWYIESERYLIKKFHITHWKNDFYTIILCACFFVSTSSFGNLEGFLLYFMLYFGLTLAFYGQEIKYLRCILKKRKNQKKQD